MKMKRRTIFDMYRRKRSAWRRKLRMLFPSPAEIKFIELMGGHCTTFGRVVHPSNHFPLVLVWSLGPHLKAERYSREVRAGCRYIDFGNDLKRGIEINGRQWHSDVLAEQERRDYLAERGWMIMYIDAARLYSQPHVVKAQVIKFLNI